MSHASKIRICEMGPRDGLQNEPELVSVEAKVALVEALADAGVPEIEVGSFVNPKLVPRMADTAEVFRRIRRLERTTYSALVPNLRGAEAAIEAGAGKLAVFTSASESFSRRNVNASIAETLERFVPVFEIAQTSGLPVRAYLSCAFGCPDEGPIAPQVAARWSRELLDRGASEVDVSDTIGVAVPVDVERVLEALAEHGVPIEATAMHFHDTRGTAVANAWTAMRRGVGILDSSCGGLGGCPFAPGATGNLATEDLLYLCERSGVATGIDFEAVIGAAKGIGAAIGRALPSRALAAAIASPSCRTGSSHDQPSRGSPSS
ncbi:MAG: hydroxymethylglutaryl-CoA lyase [Phycisphaerales bacterium]